MKCQTFDWSRITYPCFVQPKLNGVYCELKDGILASKTDKLFPAIAACNIFKPRFKDILVGELYVHGWSLQKILSAVTPDKPNDLSWKMEFHVYDIKNKDHQHTRMNLLHRDYTDTSFFKIVETRVVDSPAELNLLYKEFLADKYEGIIVRAYSGEWTDDRTWDIMKRKPFIDKEFLCIGVTEGVGKRKGHVGKFLFTTDKGIKFSCGGGQISYASLRWYLEKPPINKWITLRYQHTSDGGKPLCPQFIAVRNYE